MGWGTRIFWGCVGGLVVWWLLKRRGRRCPVLTLVPPQPDSPAPTAGEGGCA